MLTTSRRAKTGDPNTNTIPWPIERGILAHKSICHNDSPNIPKSDLPRCAHGASVMPAGVRIEPADGDGEGAVRAYGDEKEGAVLEVGTESSGEENGKAGDGYGNGDKGETKSVFEGFGEVGY